MCLSPISVVLFLVTLLTTRFSSRTGPICDEQQRTWVLQPVRIVHMFYPSCPYTRLITCSRLERASKNHPTGYKLRTPAPDEAESSYCVRVHRILDTLRSYSGAGGSGWQRLITALSDDPQLEPTGTCVLGDGGMDVMSDGLGVRDVSLALLLAG